MSEAIDRELRILVERVVRPLPASLRRKKRIRDEFLAHLHAIYAEESAREGDAGAALRRTIERFGDPEALTNELRPQVSLVDGWRRGVEWCVMQRPGESIGRYVLRLMLLQCLMMLVIFWLVPLRTGFALVLFVAMGFGGVMYFGLQWGREWEHERRRNRLLGHSAGLLTSFPAGFALMMLVAGGLPAVASVTWWNIAGLCLFSHVVGPVFGVLHTRDMTYLRQWAELDWDAAWIG